MLRSLSLLAITALSLGAQSPATTGTIVVTVAGDLKVQVKQNTSSPTAVTFSKGAWIRVSQLA